MGIGWRNLPRCRKNRYEPGASTSSGPADADRPARPGVGAEPGVTRLGVELLSAKESSARRKAAQALGRASTLQSIRVLSGALPGERSTEVRLEIVRALRTISFQRYPGYRAALVALGDADDDNNERDELVRLRATEALWEAGRKDLLDPVPLLDGNSRTAVSGCA